MPSRSNTSRWWREVDVGDLDLLFLDVLPDVELGVVRDREHPNVLALLYSAVVETPEFRTLVLRIPGTELVAERVDPLLRSGLLLIAAGATEKRVETVSSDAVEQRRCLESVTARAGPRLLDHFPGIDGVLHRGDHETGTELLDPTISECEHLGEVVARVDVHHGDRQLRRPEGLLGESKHHNAVLAA